MEQPIEFLSKGDTLRGTLFRPEGAGGRLPTVVMAGGWCYVKEIVLPHIARILSGAGVQVIAFDYRGSGESDGRRRQHLDPWMQIEDYKNAITYAETRDDVDPEAMGAFGISYSGGHVLILAATDPRIKAVVSLVPVVDGYANMKRAHGEMRFRDLEQALLDDRRRRYSGEGGTIPMSAAKPADELSTWPFAHTHRIFQEIKETEAPRHEHWSTIESTELLLNYTVFPYIGRILDKAVMVIVAEGDNLTLWDLEIEACNGVPSPTKELVILPKVSHMSIYSDRADANLAGQQTKRWFTQHLAGAGAVEADEPVATVA